MGIFLGKYLEKCEKEKKTLMKGKKTKRKSLTLSLSLLSLCSYTDDGEYEYEWDGRFSSRGVRRETQRVRALFLRKEEEKISRG